MKSSRGRNTWAETYQGFFFKNRRMHRHQRKSQNKVKNNGMKKESNNACGQHRGRCFHGCRKCCCTLPIHHCPPQFPWAEKGRHEPQKVVSAHSAKFHSMSAVASTVLSPWQTSTNQANQNLCSPPRLFPSVASSSLWDSEHEENLGLGPRSRTGLERKGYSPSSTGYQPPLSEREVKSGRTLSWVFWGGTLHRAGWGLSVYIP